MTCSSSCSERGLLTAITCLPTMFNASLKTSRERPGRMCAYSKHTSGFSAYDYIKEVPATRRKYGPTGRAPLRAQHSSASRSDRPHACALPHRAPKRNVGRSQGHVPRRCPPRWHIRARFQTAPRIPKGIRRDSNPRPPVPKKSSQRPRLHHHHAPWVLVCQTMEKPARRHVGRSPKATPHVAVSRAG